LDWQGINYAINKINTYLIKLENNIIILGANIFLTGRGRQDETNKNCFTSIGAHFNFIWILQDNASLCTKIRQMVLFATVPRYSGNGPGYSGLRGPGHSGKTSGDSENYPETPGNIQ